MATTTEPVSSDPSTTLEDVEKESHEESKAKEGDVSPLKESEGTAKEEGPPAVVSAPSVESKEKTEENESKPAVAEEVPSNANVPVPSAESEEKIKENENQAAVVEEVPSTANLPVPTAESEEKIKGNESEPPVAEEVPSVDTVEEKPKADDTPSLDVTATEPEETNEDKHIEPPPTEDAIISNVVPAADVSPGENQELPRDLIAEVDKGNVAGLPSGNSNIEPEAQPEVKDLEETEEESTKGTVVERPEEKTKITEFPESETKLEIVEGQAEELPAKVEAPAKDDVVEEVQVKEFPENTEVADSPLDKSKVEEEQGVSEELKEVTDKDVEVSAEDTGKKGDGSGSGPGEEDTTELKAEITEKLEKESVEAEPAEKISEDATKDEQNPTDKVKEAKLNDLDPIATEISEPDNTTTQEAHVEQEDKEVPPVKVAEKTINEEPLKPKEETVETENAATGVKTDDNNENSAVPGELPVPESKGIEEVASVVPTTQESEKVSEAEQTSREIELPTDIESKKNETVATIESDKDVEEVEKKVDVEEPQNQENGSGGEVVSESVETQPEKQEEVGDSGKPEAPIEETAKDTGDVKTTKEAPLKQKNSNNLLSKFKQSLVKAKKAIIKKPPTKAPPAS